MFEIPPYVCLVDLKSDGRFAGQFHIFHFEPRCSRLGLILTLGFQVSVLDMSPCSTYHLGLHPLAVAQVRLSIRGWSTI